MTTTPAMVVCDHAGASEYCADCEGGVAHKRCGDCGTVSVGSYCGFIRKGRHCIPTPVESAPENPCPVCFGGGKATGYHPDQPPYGPCVRCEGTGLVRVPGAKRAAVRPEIDRRATATATEA